MSLYETVPLCYAFHVTPLSPLLGIPVEDTTDDEPEMKPMADDDDENDENVSIY